MYIIILIVLMRKFIILYIFIIDQWVLEFSMCYSLSFQEATSYTFHLFGKGMNYNKILGRTWTSLELGVSENRLHHIWSTQNPVVCDSSSLLKLNEIAMLR